MPRKKKTLDQLARDGYVSPEEAALALEEIAGMIRGKAKGDFVKFNINIYTWFADEIKEPEAKAS